MIDVLNCPVPGCDLEFFDGDDQRDHVLDQHDAIALGDALLKVARDLGAAKANTECQRCGNYGATPGDHPLCDSCEAEVHG
jgi:hypothetical protein